MKKIGRPRHDDTFAAITALREQGVSWRRIAELLFYADRLSVYRTYQMMRRRRGLP